MADDSGLHRARQGFGSGVAFGLYGMSDEVTRCFIQHIDVDIGPRGIATGGTTYASALALAVARTVLEKVLTAQSYERVKTLGARLADGLDAKFAKRQLPWKAFRCGPRSGYCLTRSCRGPVRTAFARSTTS